MSASFILAQISDPHIMTEPRVDASGARFDHAAQLRQAFAATKEFRPDAIVMTGDLVNDARAEEYVVLAEVLREAPAPLYLLPGNHDDRALMREMLPEYRYLPKQGPLSYAVDEYPVRIVCIDDTVPGENWGAFTAEHAEWLNATLAAAPETPTLLALHHPPFFTQDRLQDEIVGLRGAELLREVVAAHAQVERVVCGHHHRGVLGAVAHALALSSPSTAWTYGVAARPDQPMGRITAEKPGWTLHAWSADASFASHFMGLP